jgi:hypothetical protein
MQRSSGAIVQAAPYNPQLSNRNYIVPRPDRWVRHATTNITTALQRSSMPSTSLPRTNPTYAASSCSDSNNPPFQKKILHLSMCMPSTRRRTIICQGRVDEIDTDRAILCFLQEQYIGHRGRFLGLARLKTVERIDFVKFLLPMGGSVALQGCITNNAISTYCDCIPPPQRVGAEYEYSPSPPKLHPPLPPEYLAGLLTCAKYVDGQDD